MKYIFARILKRCLRIIMKVNVLLTGRGNNTLKDKNVLDVLGNPVMYYPANACKKAKSVNSLYCSSDDDKILDVAASLGYIKIKRPAELALPTSQHIDAIMHGLEFMDGCGDIPDILVVALANNVTIKSKWVDDCVNIMKNDMSLTSVIPVYQDNDHHPLRAKKIDSAGLIQMYVDVKGDISTNRQDLEPCYFVSHNIWILNVSYLLSGKKGQAPWSFMGDRIKPYLIDESLDIHHKIDLTVARDWIERNYTD